MQTNLSLPWLLLASPQLQDPHFKKAVVLVVEHNSGGTMGFIVNRPVDTPLATLIDAPQLRIPEAIPAWYGGPVETTTGIIMHTNAESGGEVEITRGVYLSSDQTTLHEMIGHCEERLDELHRQRQAAPLDEFLATPSAGQSFTAFTAGGKLYTYRFLVGYAGWGSGQLDEELRQGAWVQVPMSEELLFNTSWQNMWEKGLGIVGASPKNLIAPAQPYLN